MKTTGLYTLLFSPFRVFNTNARKLITANFLFGLFNPFYLIFANTFIFSSTGGDLLLNLLYSSYNYVGILGGFILTGYLLKRIHVKNMLIIGCMMLFTSIMVLFFMPEKRLSEFWVFIFGLSTGVGNGIYWASRNYLTLVNTNDQNRNFFAGVDFILISIGRIITPLIIGFYIGEGVRAGWFSHEFAYRSTLVFAFLLVLAITLVIWPRKYRTVTPEKFLYLKYMKQWKKVRKMMVVMGFYQGALLTLPPILILKYVGNESAVGTLSSVSYLVAIFLVFYISRRTGTEHRTLILKSGIFILLVGSVLFSSLLYFTTTLATSILMVAMFIAEPIINFPFRATFMKAIDELYLLEKRDIYAYVVDIEIYAAIGRIVGLTMFYVMYITIPIYISLSIFMLFVACIQFINVRYSKIINGF